MDAKGARPRAFAAWLGKSVTYAPQEMIGKYRIIESLASGSQGTVYLAQDTTLELDVALKALHPHLATPEVIARFRREALMVASVSHPNVARISDIGEHNGAHFIAIEYVPHAASELVGRGASSRAGASCGFSGLGRGV